MTIDHLTTIAALATSLGVGATITKMWEALAAKRAGRHKEEQAAWVQRDKEARARRMLEEYAGELRAALHAQGVPYGEMPPWPQYRTHD